MNLTITEQGPALARLPVTIDWTAALALRQMAALADDLPKYLLAPEVVTLLHYIPDLTRRSLFATLWNCGPRINEALQITRHDLQLQGPYPFVRLATLKQREAQAARGAGRRPAGLVPHRLVPLSDPQYVSLMEMTVATLRIPLERRDPASGRMERVRLWNITDRTARTWLSEALAAAAADGVTFSVPVTLHTFRHSYAMHLLTCGMPLKALQALLGHRSLKSTEEYTRIFALDVAATRRVQFQMPEQEALRIVRDAGNTPALPAYPLPTGRYD